MERNQHVVAAARGLGKRRFLWTLYITELGLILLSLVVARLFLGDYFPYKLDADIRSIVLGLMAAVPVALVVWAMMTGPVARLVWVDRAMSRINDKLFGPFGQSIRSLSTLEIVLLSCAAGIGEEIFFRGLLQSFVGIWWAAVVFGLLHALTPAYFLLATAIGLWFGFLYQVSGNLLVPVMAHAAYDIFALVMLRALYARR